MARKDEFVSLLRRITLDGILSAHEVWELAQFINEHPGVADKWPGNILYGIRWSDATKTPGAFGSMAGGIIAVTAPPQARTPTTRAAQTG